jgi:hypothetical protein
LHCSSDKDDHETYIVNELKSRLGCKLSQMTIMILKGSQGEMTQYPANILQNLALKGVQMMHAAYINLDFLYILQGLA